MSAKSQRPATRPPFRPNKPITLIPCARACSQAATTFDDSPDVEIAKTSVVSNARKYATVSRERDCRQRPPFHEETIHQLAGNVLCVRGRTAVSQD